MVHGNLSVTYDGTNEAVNIIRNSRPNNLFELYEIFLLICM